MPAKIKEVVVFTHFRHRQRFAKRLQNALLNIRFARVSRLRYDNANRQLADLRVLALNALKQ